MAAPIFAYRLEPGDMLDLCGDIVFDPFCDVYCLLQTENVEVVEAEADGSEMKVIMRNSHETFSGSVPMNHKFYTGT